MSMMTSPKPMPSRRWDLAAAVPKEHRPRQRQDLPSELHVAQHVVAPGGLLDGKTMGKIMGGTMGTMGISPISTGQFRLVF